MRSMWTEQSKTSFVLSLAQPADSHNVPLILSTQLPARLRQLQINLRP